MSNRPKPRKGRARIRQYQKHLAPCPKCGTKLGVPSYDFLQKHGRENGTDRVAIKATCCGYYLEFKVIP